MHWRWRPPAEVATRIARLLLAEPDAPHGAPRTFPLADFQEEAARRAQHVLVRRGGVIVADDVGLGKTYVALALMEEALRRREGVALVVPAALRGAWTPLVRGIAGREGASPDVYVTTHARLSRGSHDRGRLCAAGLVVVDEAHAFRNSATRRYRALAERGAGSRLVLVTATPMNNGPADLHALVRQFARDDAFGDIGLVSLRAALLDGDDASVAGAAARIAREVVVRRTRADLDERPGGPPAGFRFPRRAATALIRYDDPAVPGLVSAVSELELAPYALDERGRPSEGPRALIKLGLLKRLESGRPAIGGSLRRLRSLLSRFVDAANSGRLLRPADQSAEVEDGDAVQLSLEEVLLESAAPGTDLAALAASARRDLDRIARMLRDLEGPDPKLEALRGWLGGLGADEKIVIFSEFRDTAAALWRALAPTGRAGRVDGAGAWLGSRRAGRRAVVERFAPVSSGVAPPPARERVDVLIATDVLSEGLNLQDAATVVSYDLPWNPVRLLQRIGRVDRLGSPHELVRPVLFVPGAGLDDVLRLTRRLRKKLGGIAATLGAGDAGELLVRLGGSVTVDPLDALIARSRDPWERLRARLREDVPCGEGSVSQASPGSDTEPSVAAAVCSGGSTPLAWLVLARERGKPPVLFVADAGGAVHEAGGEAAAALEGALSQGAPGSPDGARADARRRLDDAARAVVAAAEARASAGRAPPRMDGRGPAARVARRLRKEAAAVSVPDPEVIRRTDAILTRLATPPDLRTRAALIELEASEPEPGSLLRALEQILSTSAADAPPAGPAPGDFRVGIEILAALAVDAAALCESDRHPVDEAMEDH